MALLGKRSLGEQNVEGLLNEAQDRWLNATEICKIFENHGRLHILASQRQERPSSGSLFVIKLQRLREFKNDGHIWSKKKDGKTIQESHAILKVCGFEKLNCLYAYGENNANFQRRIYRMIEKEDVDIVLFHYREDEENRKNCKRGRKTTKVTTQSSQEAGKAIPTLVITGSQGSSTGIVDHGSNQLPLSSQTTGASNLNNIRGNVEYAGFFYGVVNHDNCQLPLPAKTTDTSNQNDRQGYYESAGSSFGTVIAGSSSGIVDHDSYQLHSSPKTTDTSNLKNIQGYFEPAGFSSGIVNHDRYQLPPKTTGTNNQSKIQGYYESAGNSSGLVDHESYQFPSPSQSTYKSNPNNILGYDESAVCINQASSGCHLFSDLLQNGMQMTDGGFFDTCYGISLTGDGMQDYNNFENQLFPQVTEDDFLSDPGTPGSPCELLELMKSMEQFSEENILETTDSLSGIVDHDGHQLLLPDIVSHDSCQLPLPSQTTYTSYQNNVQGYAKSGDGMPHYENDSENLASLPENDELMKYVEQFSESCNPVVDPIDNYGDIASEILRIRFENLLSTSSVCPKYDDSSTSKIPRLIKKLTSLPKISLEGRFYLWLLEKSAEGGNGLTVMDEGGQGVIHLAAGLGYNWALKAIVAAEIDINLSDKNEWTALDWAIHCGRKHTIEFLISNGAAPGLQSIPLHYYPFGNPPVD